MCKLYNLICKKTKVFKMYFNFLFTISKVRIGMDGILVLNVKNPVLSFWRCAGNVMFKVPETEEDSVIYSYFVGSEYIPRSWEHRLSSGYIVSSDGRHNQCIC